jgi:Fe2+ or Zn2+ uptake regulation protein
VTRFHELMAAERRLEILQVLAESAEYTAHEGLLQAVLSRAGLPSSLDQLASELAWLEEQGLLQSEPFHGLIIAHLTPRGLDVATGRARVPGVQRPRP